MPVVGKIYDFSLPPASSPSQQPSMCFLALSFAVLRTVQYCTHNAELCYSGTSIERSSRKKCRYSSETYCLVERLLCCGFLVSVAKLRFIVLSRFHCTQLWVRCHPRSFFYNDWFVLVFFVGGALKKSFLSPFL